VVTLTTPDTVEVRCGATAGSTPGGYAEAYATKLVAIQASPQ